MRYRTIVADPPWPYDEMTAPWYSGSRPAYPLLPIEDIVRLPIDDFAAPDAHLYVWATLPMMEQAYQVVRAWKFRPVTAVTWCKPGPGLGAGWRGNTEHLIVARRGETYRNPTCATCGGRARGARKCACDAPAWRHKGVPFTDVMAQPFLSTARGTWYQAPRGQHSEKPALFLDLIEQMSPPPRLELFARSQRLGWHTWGNEALNHVEITQR